MFWNDATERQRLKYLIDFCCFCRASPVCSVLPAAAGWRDLWHRHGDRGPDAHRHLLWQHYRIVSRLSAPVNQTGTYKRQLTCSPWLTLLCASFGSNEASPGFELRVELYSCCSEDDYSAGSTPRKLASKLSSSLGRSAGKKLRAAMEPGPCSPVSNGGAAPLLLPVPSVPWVSFKKCAR